MTNVVTRDGYNIPKLIYDGSITATNVRIGDAEDFRSLREQVTRSGVFILKRTDPNAAEGFLFASIDSPTSIIGYRVYSTPSGMQLLFVTVSNPVSRPNDMLYSGVQKSIAAAT